MGMISGAAGSSQLLGALHNQCVGTNPKLTVSPELVMEIFSSSNCFIPVPSKALPD